MISWKELYREKVTDPATAIGKSIKSGDQVVLGHCAGAPVVLNGEMIKQSDRFDDVKVFHMVPLHDCSYCGPEFEGKIRHNTIFCGKPTRRAINEGRGDFIPCFFSELPKIMREGYLPVDTAMIRSLPRMNMVI